MYDYPLLYECLFPGCRCMFAGTKAARKHARQKHVACAWLAALPAARVTDNYCRLVGRPRHIIERYNNEQFERYFPDPTTLANYEHYARARARAHPGEL